MPSSMHGVRPETRSFERLDYIIEHRNDSQEWCQLGLPTASEADACKTLEVWRKTNPTQAFRVVERISKNRIVDA